MPLALAQQTSTDSPNYAWCSWLYFFGLNSLENCLTKASQEQIQSVADNASTYYGPNSNVAQVAQQMATQQEALVPQDTQNIATFYNLPSSPFIPSTGPGFDPTDPSTWPTWLWIALAAGGGLLVIRTLR